MRCVNVDLPRHVATFFHLQYMKVCLNNVWIVQSQTKQWMCRCNHVVAMFMRSAQSKHFALLGIVCVSTAFLLIVHLQGEVSRLDEARIQLGN